MNEETSVSDNQITYEQPLNERIRQFLRLEHLFQLSDNTLHGISDWESRNTLSCLTDIIDILSRSDIKTDVLKFLERLQLNLSQLRHSDAIDKIQLDTVLEQIEQNYNALHAIHGKLASDLKEHNLINNLMQRGAVTAGVNSFDIPQFHHWLQQEPDVRIASLYRWFESLEVLRQPIELILDLIRSSTEAVTVDTEQGFYQQALDTNKTYHLIRVSIPANTPYYAEISGGRHRVSIRFLQPQDRERPIQIEDDLSFELSCCSL
ncbi:MAG: cell division protein ZapD [Gammaproteobacteria bacterium]|nr:cell division protein ZapD [Gammaproteobacteria bacterium]